jgi:hypothetical protein
MDNQKEVFRTHSNYIRALAYLAGGGWTTRKQAYGRLYQRIMKSGSIPDKQNPNVNHEQVRRILENGWGTELLMTLGSSIIEDDELIRISNNWSAVQCYYVTYHAVQALAVAKGFPRPDSHPKTQKEFVAFWCHLSDELAPWTISVHADGYHNVPNLVTIDTNIHSWSSCTRTTSWSLACKALRTTRDDLVSEALRKRRESKRASNRRSWRDEELVRSGRGRRPRKDPRFPLPTLTQHEKQDVNARTRPTTIIHYLYRVRIKTNYEDSAMFTDGPEDEQVSDEIRNHLCLLSGTTLLLHEVQIAALVGKDRFLEWVHEWISQRLPDDFRSGLVERNIFHQRLCSD